MNILLIHPYINSSTPTLYLNEPLGLICLATYLEKCAQSKRQIDILDLYALGHDRVTKNGGYYNIGISDPEAITRMVEAYSPDIIGITCNFTTYTRVVFELANLLKENFPEAFVTLGGAHASMDAENILAKHCAADVVVRGEGEQSFNELVERVENKSVFCDIPGITYRRDGQIVSNPRRPLIPDINVLPIPDRKYIQQDVYSQINRKMYFLSKGRKVASIMTSRGCPFNCIFCSTKVVWERKFRPRSPELVVAEMERLIRDHHVDEFLINDDQFYLDKERVVRICDMIVERGFNIAVNVASGSSNWLLDENLLGKLKKAGLYRITFPIETGSKRTLKYIRKPIDLEKTKKMIRLANSLGIWTYANFILGFPYEKHENLQETVGYANKSGLDYATFFIAKPYAGSEMYEDFKKEGLSDGSAIQPTTMGEVGHDIVYMSAEELQKIRDKAQKRYFLFALMNYSNPFFFRKYVYPKINSLDGLEYFARSLRSAIRHFVTQPLSQKLKLINERKD